MTKTFYEDYMKKKSANPGDGVPITLSNILIELSKENVKQDI